MGVEQYDLIPDLDVTFILLWLLGISRICRACVHVGEGYISALLRLQYTDH